LFAGASTHHVAGALAHEGHFSNPGAGVRRRDVASAHALDKTAHCLKQRLALVFARVTNDHRLAATQWQPGQRRLVRHATGQAQHIVQGLLLVGIGPHAATAQGWPQARVVHRNNGLEARGLVMTELDVFVVIEFGVGKNRHCVLSLVFSQNASQTLKSVCDPWQKSEGFT